MRGKTQTILAVSAVLALGACSAENSTVFSSWNQPAGAFLDEGQFGNPTMQNLMAQKCAGQAKGYIVPDPIVVLDPKSATPMAPAQPYRAYLRCSGHLNGKYAEVIFQEYVDSATQARADSTAQEAQLTPGG